MSTDKEYIRKGVELADGWNLTKDTDPIKFKFGVIEIAMTNEYYEQFGLDALAAQLVRQVDFHGHYVTQYVARTDVTRVMDQEVVASSKTDDLRDDNARTMNTIKAIVDSKALEGDT